jgi:hypothetical protein
MAHLPRSLSKIIMVSTCEPGLRVTLLPRTTAVMLVATVTFRGGAVSQCYSDWTQCILVQCLVQHFQAAAQNGYSRLRNMHRWDRAT